MNLCATYLPVIGFDTGNLRRSLQKLESWIHLTYPWNVSDAVTKCSLRIPARLAKPFRLTRWPLPAPSMLQQLFWSWLCAQTIVRICFYSDCHSRISKPRRTNMVQHSNSNMQMLIHFVFRTSSKHEIYNYAQTMWWGYRHDGSTWRHHEPEHFSVYFFWLDHECALSFRLRDVRQSVLCS